MCVVLSFILPFLISGCLLLCNFLDFGWVGRDAADVLNQVRPIILPVLIVIVVDLSILVPCVIVQVSNAVPGEIMEPSFSGWFNN